MRKSESVVQAEIRQQAGQLGIYLFRNNNGACTDQTGRVIRYGLGNDSAVMNKRLKSSDLIGILPNGKFLAVECKHSEWKWPKSMKHNNRLTAQLAWINLIKHQGGVAGFATGVDDFNQLVEGYLK